MKLTLPILAVILLCLPACRTEPPQTSQSPPPRRLGRGTGDPVVGERCWGIARLSVATAREKPDHLAEMGTQILLGRPVKLIEQRRNWFLVQATDGYEAWLEDGTFTRRTAGGVEDWNRSGLGIVTAMEGIVYKQPDPRSPAVSDVVLGNLVKMRSRTNDWLQIEFPDGRTGWLAGGSAEDYSRWKATRDPTPENLERTARSLMGRPYLWGANSPKGLDCSGFTQLVYAMNGIALRRNSSQQATEGTDVPLDAELRNLRRGDLIFFGHKAFDGQAEKIVHVGMYLQDKLFIHSSEMVQVNSLDPASPIRDERRIRTLVRAKRML